MNEYAIVVWNPPSFVADDINSLSYRVVIVNDNDNILVDIVTIEWENEVSIDILSICSIYTLIVTAYDNQYTSDSSIIQDQYIGGNYIICKISCHYPSIEYSAVIVDSKISVDSEGTANFTVEFTIRV